jgi:hypothetical protein
MGETFESYIIGVSVATDCVERVLTIRAPSDILPRNGKLTLEPSQPGLLKAVLGQHALHSAAQYLSTTPFGEHLIHCHALQATGASRVGIVQLLEAFLSGCSEIMATGNNNVVTAVRRGIVNGLVLSHQDEGD